MASNTPHVILLSGDPIGREALSAAATAINPGMLVEVTSAGELQEHATAGGNAQALFARNADYVGMGIDETFAAGDTVPYSACRAGDQVYSWLATGNDVVPGDPLESDGAGGLQKHAVQSVDEGGNATYDINTEAVVARAVESLNNTSGSQSRLRVEVT